MHYTITRPCIVTAKLQNPQQKLNDLIFLRNLLFEYTAERQGYDATWLSPHTVYTTYYCYIVSIRILIFFDLPRVLQMEGNDEPQQSRRFYTTELPN